MTVPPLTLVQLAGEPGRPLLVVGPSLGTSAATLWGEVAALLGDRCHVVGWELPGHGTGAPAAESFSMAELATGVLAALDAAGLDGAFGYAGDSVGGAVGLELALAAPDRLTAAALLCSAARFGEPEGWLERAALVRGSGTPVMVSSSAARWFGPGFVERHPQVVGPLLDSLHQAHAESYALVCEALAAFDARDRLAEVKAPVLVVSGTADVPTPGELQQELAAGLPQAALVELDGIGHLAPAEAPRAVASLLAAHVVDRRVGRGVERGVDPYDAGMTVRRQVLGDAHVDRASAGITDITRDFQELITRYAWGSVWTRPGLARRDRSIAVLTALVAGRHFEELEFHLRAALRNGLSREEIVEVLLQSAIYIGVPAANTAFGVAARVLGDPNE